MAARGSAGAGLCVILAAIAASATQSAPAPVQCAAWTGMPCSSQQIAAGLGALRIRGGSAFAALEDEVGDGEDVTGPDAGEKPTGGGAKPAKATGSKKNTGQTGKDAPAAIPDHTVFNPPAPEKAPGEGAESEAQPKQAAAAEVAVAAQAPPAEPAEKTAAELEEENYKEMQNFEDYAKTKRKSSTLTLADLMGGGGSVDENALGVGEEAHGEEAEYGEEEYYEEGEYCEGEDGEYHEEETAPPPELDGVAALRSRKERAMENLDDWWSGSIGVDIENERRLQKRTTDDLDPLVVEDKAKLASSLQAGARGASAGARRGGGGDGTRGLIRRPDMSAVADDDGRTRKLVSKLFAEQRAGNTGKQTAGSQTMFQRAEPTPNFGSRGGARGGSRGGGRGRGGMRGRGGFDDSRGRGSYQQSWRGGGEDQGAAGGFPVQRKSGGWQRSASSGGPDGEIATAEGVGPGGAATGGALPGRAPPGRGRFPSRGFSRGRGGAERGRGGGESGGQRGGFGAFRGGARGNFDRGASRGGFRGVARGGRGDRGQGSGEDDFPALRSTLAAA